MKERGTLPVQPRLEGTNLFLKPVYTGLQLEQLGPQRDLVEPLFYGLKPLLHSVKPLLYPLQARHHHVVLGFELVEAFVDLIEMDVHSQFEGIDSFPYDALDVRQEDLAMEASQDRKKVLGHEGDGTSHPAAIGPKAS